VSSQTVQEARACKLDRTRCVGATGKCLRINKKGRSHCRYPMKRRPLIVNRAQRETEQRFEVLIAAEFGGKLGASFATG